MSVLDPITPSTRHGHGDDPRVPAVVALRPLATPLSLGFLTLAAASFVVSGVELSWVDPVGQREAIALILIVFAAPLQLGSAVFGFLTRDAVAAAGIGLIGGTWLAVGVTMVATPPGSVSGGLGLLLVAAAVGLLVPAVAGSASKLLATGVLALVAVRFAVTGGYELSGSAGWQTAAGVVGLVTSAVALYAALAFELEAAHRHTVLPIGRHGVGRISLTGDFADQIEGVQHEPGVRREL